MVVVDGSVAGFGYGAATVGIVGSEFRRNNINRCIAAGLLSLDAGRSRP